MPDTPQRIALIVVHGVADQRPGETAQSVIDLLVAAPPAGVAYAAKSSETFTLPVEPMQPQNAPASDRPATPEAADRSASKSFAQSLRSDFQRDDWKAPDSPAALVTSMRKAAAAGIGTVDVEAPDERREDRGIRTSTFLLSKHVRNGARSESFTTARTRLERHAHGATPARQQVDVYEMYWADLSRLSGAVPRIVTELFTMVFRLSKLGARYRRRGARGDAGRRDRPRQPPERLFGLPGRC